MDTRLRILFGISRAHAQIDLCGILVASAVLVEARWLECSGEPGLQTEDEEEFGCRPRPGSGANHGDFPPSTRRRCLDSLEMVTTFVVHIDAAS